MKNETEQLEALQDIRKMMKESSRFLSLSGLSGVMAGIYALCGAYLGHLAISSYIESERGGSAYEALVFRVLLICVLVLLISVSTALLLSYKKAARNNHRLFDHSSKKLFWSMFVPLAAGGGFCLALLYHGTILFVSPAMLIFYGLALTSSSRLTLNEIRYLGYFEILLGLTACFLPGHGLLFWTLGFGLMHIIYGSIMWYKYDR